MIDGLFGSLFGAAMNEPYPGYQKTAEQALTFLDLHYHSATPRRELPPGIFWERTGGQTHRVTIRREPEWVVDLSGLGNVP